MRTRLLPASEPDAEPFCRLTPEEGRRRQAGTDRLFARLRDQHQAGNVQEYFFAGDPDQLWQDLTLFVDEEAQCCPFFTFEQIERSDGVTLRVSGKAIG
ncbi:MAG TPA: hypothetical protein VNL15_05450 [Dehalococcoidia bacterium]|nr:hypothetical protein [Dehalococcoidia bacterium]